MQRFLVVLPLAVLAACGAMPFAQQQEAPPAEAAAEAAPVPAVAASPLPRPAGRTAAALDTTTEAERAAALAAPQGGERQLGRAVASLGAPGEPGIWVKTPLVSAPVPGRIDWQGQSLSLELRPADDGSGTTQISLAALRLLGAPLTGLPEITIYAR
jgi:hypothetical protein